MLGSLLACSHEALVIDNDMLGSINRTVRGIEVDEETLSAALIADVVNGPGHFLGSDQTLELMQREYLYPVIGDRDTPDDWLEAGGRDALAVAHDHAAGILGRHHPTHVPAAAEAAVRDRWGLRLDRPLPS
ncbi:MAG: hypothetical protein GWN79_05690 [Actinobacteria bacterium]|nr:hypothetical protein [Actinomycetota bacterium]NIS30379.1 hypothetical protein [Actinomycetota bacterium]NIT94935.1 hypothetical protein [Actinomycetota bacterium]NIU18607.1 hypothetical protein [Actinomycetota bacterium]NIU65609.1 hypothetical protein [Actinomycetota bacterium]